MAWTLTYKIGAIEGTLTEASGLGVSDGSTPMVSLPPIPGATWAQAILAGLDLTDSRGTLTQDGRIVAEAPLVVRDVGIGKEGQLTLAFSHTPTLNKSIPRKPVYCTADSFSQINPVMEGALYPVVYGSPGSLPSTWGFVNPATPIRSDVTLPTTPALHAIAISTDPPLAYDDSEFRPEFTRYVAFAGGFQGTGEVALFNLTTGYAWDATLLVDTDLLGNVYSYVPGVYEDSGLFSCLYAIGIKPGTYGSAKNRADQILTDLLQGGQDPELHKYKLDFALEGVTTLGDLVSELEEILPIEAITDGLGLAVYLWDAEPRDTTLALVNPTIASGLAPINQSPAGRAVLRWGYDVAVGDYTQTTEIIVNPHNDTIALVESDKLWDPSTAYRCARVVAWRQCRYRWRVTVHHSARVERGSAVLLSSEELGIIEQVAIATQCVADSDSGWRVLLELPNV